MLFTRPTDPPPPTHTHTHTPLPNGYAADEVGKLFYTCAKGHVSRYQMLLARPTNSSYTHRNRRAKFAPRNICAERYHFRAKRERKFLILGKREQKLYYVSPQSYTTYNAVSRATRAKVSGFRKARQSSPTYRKSYYVKCMSADPESYTR